jgi:RNA polymerase sigma-70 factor (ECF subfamily)
MGLIGRYQLEAAIQSAHVSRRRGGRPNWPAVVKLYDALLELTGSPVAAINRAIAVAEIEGPAAALAILDRVSGDARVVEYQPYWAARADLLARIGALPEARDAYEIAIGLERDPSLCNYLERRRASLAPE